MPAEETARPEQPARAPHLDARLTAAAALVRPGSAVADIGCDHGKLTAALALRGDCPRVIGTDLRPGPLAAAAATCAAAGCAGRVQLRLGGGLLPIAPGEVRDIVLAGMSAGTIEEILQGEGCGWVRDPALRLILIPATRHGQLRAWLCRNGFALREDRPVRAAGRWYAVMAAEYTGRPTRPGAAFCVLGRTGSYPGAAGYRAQELAKLAKICKGLRDEALRGQLTAVLRGEAAAEEPLPVEPGS